jgi:propionyl-CoA synthetase
VAEAAVVGIPDQLKGHLPFAFVTLAGQGQEQGEGGGEGEGEGAVPSSKLVGEIQQLVREQIGAIATLGGVIQGKGMIPKTRSGKTLRRVLRELVENATHDEFDREVAVPSTIEDAEAVRVARAKVREYFETKGRGMHRAVEGRAKL